MLPRPKRILSSPIPRAALLVGMLLLFPIDSLAEQNQNNVICREDFSQTRRDDVAARLRKITGWSDLRFEGGTLRQGAKDPVGGSQSARDLITKIIYGANVIVLEDASGRSDVVFSRVVPGKWKPDAPDRPPGFVVQIDFTDFDHVIGDARALLAFNVGWVLLHEFDHVMNDSEDAASLVETGECEDHINKMRRECNLPQRADYFSTFLPLGDSVFIAKWVRLAFEQGQEKAGRKKRYWIIWDAKLVGGLDDQKQIASLR